MKRVVVALGLAVALLGAGRAHATATTPELGVATSPASAPAWAAALGAPVRMLANFVSWSTPFSYSAYLRTLPRRVTPLVTWQPDAAGGNAAIVAGDSDSYIRRVARALAAFRRPVYLRYAHEMNGSWYPWSEGSPQTYVAAWRRVHSIFAAEGATNVRFVWSPNAAGATSSQFVASVAPYWPGSRYVDSVGLTTIESHGSVERYVRFLDALHRTFPRQPQMLPELNGTTAVWVGQFARAIRARPWIGVLVWYEKPAYGTLLARPEVVRALRTALH